MPDYFLEFHVGHVHPTIIDGIRSRVHYIVARTRKIKNRLPCRWYYTVQFRYKPNVSYSNVLTEVEFDSEVKLTKDTPYLVLKGELWGVNCDYFRENSPRYFFVQHALFHV